MAAAAQRDQEKRVVQVNRVQLIKTLENNLKNHIKDYEEALKGYKGLLNSKIEDGYKKALSTIEYNYKLAKERVANLTDEDITKQRDCFTLLESIYVEMKVPKSYADQYQVAIDIFKWDVREIAELSYAEFACFVRDEWDWQQEFQNISKMYKT